MHKGPKGGRLQPPRWTSHRLGACQVASAWCQARWTVMTWLQDLETDDVCWMISRFAELLKCWLKVKTARASRKDNKDSLWLFHLTTSSCVNLANSWLSPATIFTGPATYRSCEQGSWEANCWYPGLSKECTKHVQAHNMKHIDGAPHPPGAGASAGQTVGGHTWVENRDHWKSGTAHTSFSKGHPPKKQKHTEYQNALFNCKGLCFIQAAQSNLT